MTKILVDVDDQVLATAAARLGTRTKKDTIARALDLVVTDRETHRRLAMEWDDWADGVGDRLGEVDWDQAWR